MLGGNQRDLARSKAAKKQADANKSKSASEKEGNKGMTLEARKQRWFLYSNYTRWIHILYLKFTICSINVVFRDADMMREKQKLKEQKQAQDGAKKWKENTSEYFMKHIGLAQLFFLIISLPTSRWFHLCLTYYNNIICACIVASYIVLINLEPTHSFLNSFTKKMK